MRYSRIVPLHDVDGFKARAVLWASQFRHAVCLDSNSHRQKYSSFDFLIAADALDWVRSGFDGAFKKLEDFHLGHGDWSFGFLGYDLKNGLEDLHSGQPLTVGFPDLEFFRPRRLMILRGDSLELLYFPDDLPLASADVDQILSMPLPLPSSPGLAPRPKISRSQYLERVAEMQERIALGDIYEANFCMEFTAEGDLDPVGTYLSLNQISSAPFSAFLRMGELFLMSASPERFLRKEGDKCISQPIKGTAPRHPDHAIDSANAQRLSADPKERSENIMIVDLVRNDLSRTADKGSVAVEELCGVHTFKQVHQLISTVTSRLRSGVSAFEVLQTTFPMGSMTGAPKISAMKIIDALEPSRRGIYSGAVGYLTPECDFDFNVVIRSIAYDCESKSASFHVGSAITHLSDPMREYDECMVKASAMMRVLGG